MLLIIVRPMYSNMCVFFLCVVSNLLVPGVVGVLSVFFSSSALELALKCFVINHMMLYHSLFPNTIYSAYLVHENHYYLSRII